MDSIKTNLKFWLAGMIAGIVLMERWRRYGRRNVPVAESVREDDVEASSMTTASTESAVKPKASALIVTGARADAERVRRFLGLATPLPSETADSQPSTPTSA
jgi:hypothetical protein